MSSVLYRIGHAAARHPWRMVMAWLVVAAAVVSGSSALGGEFEDSFSVPGTDSELATQLLTDSDSDRAGLTARVVFAADGDSTLATAGARAEIASIAADLAELDEVIAVTDPFDGGISPDERIALVTMQYPVIEELTVDDLAALEATIEDARSSTSMQVEAGGDLFFAFDEAESGATELVGILVAVVVLLLAFGSVIAMGLPIGTALFGLALGISSISLVARVIDVPSWAPQIAAMIGLGVGIDYALFLVTRHRELLHGGVDVAHAVGTATATAGQAVVFAGGTVVIAILGLAVAGVPFMTAAGVAISVVVLVMVVASITLLPAFLGIAGPWIDRFGIHRHRAGAVGDGWTRWGAHVSRHAWKYAVGVTAALLVATAPVLSLDLGFPDDGTLPESTTQRRAYDLVAEGFGPGINGPLVIAVDMAGDAQVAASVADAVSADEGVATASVVDIDLDEDVATVIAVPTTAPQDEATFATVERLRAAVIPVVTDGTDAKVHVGGATATFGDVSGRVTDRLPVFIAAVIALSFVLLTLVFRSVLVPLKAALLNLLSIGAAYGVLVAVFQWGWGKDLIGLEATIPVVSFVPMFMFAILFGLSMDYEVFLLSRVREEYVRTGDNDRAVVHGLATTARVITSAALIMISVFGGFVLGSDPTTKMFGLGLATAIFVDATIVRIVLVPATMKLLGDANWWLPAWLDRLLPHIDIGEGGEPAATSEPRIDPTPVSV
ncbi:MAG: MMPL family transporter [Ilumatobacter sp.]